MQQVELFGRLKSPRSHVSLYEFERETSLIPKAILEQTAQEILAYLQGSPRLDQLGDFLGSPELLQAVHLQTCSYYSENDEFHNECLKPTRGNYYLGFVRHWVYTAMLTHLPSIAQRLPPTFRVGAPLPAKRRVLN